MLDHTPYLSVVVTARNDDHGGNLLRRMQTFVNAWIGQSKRYGLCSELIVVEWNPPPDRASLREALTWPPEMGACTVRFIEVPAEVHRRYRHAEALPLYQMIAKNVGIRKARAPFVLATNIDILFSDELVRYFAERRLCAGRMYRIDRYDVASDVPVEDSIEQLAYCRAHMLRVNSREGTYKLTPDGQRALDDQDIARPDSGVLFGKGWFPVERHSREEVFRWVADDAELLVRIPSNPPPTLSLEIEAGPGVGRQPFRLQLVVESGEVAAEADLEERAVVTVHFPHDGPAVRRFRFRVIGGGHPVENDPRIMNFRVFPCWWGNASQTGTEQIYRLEGGRSSRRALSVVPSLASKLARAYRFYLEAGAGLRKAGIAAVNYYVRSSKCRGAMRRRGDIVQPGSGIQLGNRWFPAEHYLGETFRWARKNAELIVHAPKTTRRGDLVLVIEPGPGVGYQPFELLIQSDDGRIVVCERIEGLQVAKVTIPLKMGEIQVFRLTLEGGDLPAEQDTRSLNFRVFWCGWSRAGSSAADPASASPKGDAAPSTQGYSGDQLPANGPCTPVYLHTNGCGDFTLMAREHWFDLRGYPEFDLFSMNLDSVLCYAAHHAGFREDILDNPMCIYHIEHQTGSGWTPEGQAMLFARLAVKGLPFIDYQEVTSWAVQMRRLNSPMIFNRENWGLADLELPETVLPASRSIRAAT